MRVLLIAAAPGAYDLSDITLDPTARGTCRVILERCLRPRAAVYHGRRVR